MRYKTLIRSSTIFALISIFYLAIYFLFLSGLIGSFLIQEKIFNALGFLNLISLIGFGFLGLFLGERIEMQNYKFKVLYQIPETIFFLLILAINIIASVAMYNGVLSNLIHGQNIFSLSFLIALMGNTYRSSIVWGEGYTILNNLFFVSISFSYYYYEKTHYKKYKYIIYYNIILIILSSFLYGARLKLVMLFIIIFLNYVRKDKYLEKVNFFKLLIILLAIIFLLSLWGGLRGVVSDIYKKWTDNIFIWNSRIFTDYFVSTTMFSVEGLGSDKNISLSEVRDNLGPYEIRGYTNFGRYMQVYKSFGLFSFLFTFFTSFIYGIVWKSFDKGRKFGLLFYPYVFYFVAEGLRIEPLLVLDFQFIIITMFLLYLLPVKL